MKFHCPGCQIAFSVPDEKIPEGKGVRILCPKCRKPVERTDATPVNSAPVQLEGSEQPSPAATAAPEPVMTMPDPVPMAMHSDDDEETEEDSSSLEVVEEGVKTALLCLSDSSRMQAMEEVLRQLDFYVSTAGRPKVALTRLHQNRYDLVMLDETFDGSQASENLVLHHIQLLPMHIKRRFFLCLVSEKLPSMDRLLAFRLGVNLTLNAADLDKAKIILVREMKDYGAFYKVFNDELARKGQH